MRQLLRHQAILIIVAGLMFLVDLSGSALLNDDEARCAASAAEMMARKAWIVPTFNEELTARAPILNDWLMILSFRQFGVSEFAARIASAVLAVGTVLLTYHMGRKLYSADIGLLGGLVLCSCLVFSRAGRSAAPDAVATFFTTLSFAVYVWIIAQQRGVNFCRRNLVTTANKKPEPVPTDDSAVDADKAAQPPSLISRIMGITRSTSNPLVFAVAVFAPIGLVCLASGPESVLMSCATYVLFLLISRRYDDLEAGVITPPIGPKWKTSLVTLYQLFRPQTVVRVIREMNLSIGLMIAIGIAVPWYLSVIAATGGAWVKEFLAVYAELPLANPSSAFMQVYHLFLVWLGCFPWAAFVPVVLYRLWERLSFGAPWRESDQFLMSWVIVWFVAMALFSSRLPNACLPLFPALALLMARYFVDWSREKVNSSVYSFSLCCRATWIVGFLFALGLTFATYLYFPSEQWVASFALIPVAAGFAAAWLVEQERRPIVIRTLTWSAVAFSLLMAVVLPSRFHQYQDTPIFVSEARNAAKADGVVFGTYDYFEPTVVFYTRRKVQVLKTAREAADFLSDNPHSFILMHFTKLNRNSLNETIIGGGRDISRHRNFFHGRELVLIGRN